MGGDGRLSPCLELPESAGTVLSESADLKTPAFARYLYAPGSRLGLLL